MSRGQGEPTAADPAHTPVTVVGPGWTFLSGISFHVAALGEAFTRLGHPTDLLLFRRLCPAVVYPGRDRIGTHGPGSIAKLAGAPHRELLDWFWGPNIVRAARRLRRQRGGMLILSWWTGTALHTYLLLALLARSRKTSVVLDFHETLDVGEARIPLVKPYVRFGMRLLARLATRGVVHSTPDLERIPRELPVGNLPLQVIPIGPTREHPAPRRERGAGEPVRLLYYGVQRAYKGLDELAEATRILDAQGENFTLTVAGERWEDCSAAHAVFDTLGDRVRRIDGYVSNEQLDELLATTDIVVLPYRRSTGSGPLHDTMASGLPVVVTDVPALVDVATSYTGAVIAPRENAAGLADAIRRSFSLAGSRHANPYTWTDIARRFLR
jgi:glycosyltransferase involved in cell wall biosynthesis